MTLFGFFDHCCHTLSLRNVDVRLDVLAFEDHEYLSEPFRYRVEFTSTQRVLAAETLLCKHTSLSLYAHPANANSKLLNGWEREEVGVIPWVSPWEWQGYAVITDYTSAPIFMAAFLRSLKRFTDEQLQRDGPLADAGDAGPIKKRLWRHHRS